MLPSVARLLCWLVSCCCFPPPHLPLPCLHPFMDSMHPFLDGGESFHKEHPRHHSSDRSVLSLPAQSSVLTTAGSWVPGAAVLVPLFLHMSHVHVLQEEALYSHLPLSHGFSSKRVFPTVNVNMYIYVFPHQPLCLVTNNTKTTQDCSTATTSFARAYVYLLLENHRGTMFNDLLICIVVCMTVCPHECMCTSCVPVAFKAREEVTSPGLELQMLVSCPVVLGIEPSHMQEKKIPLISEMCLYLLVTHCQKIFFIFIFYPWCTSWDQVGGHSHSLFWGFLTCNFMIDSLEISHHPPKFHSFPSPSTSTLYTFSIPNLNGKK